MRALLALVLLPAVTFAQNPPPPSTGNEMPKAKALARPTYSVARQELLQLRNDAKDPKRDCKKLINAWTRLVLMVAKPSADEVREDLEGYLWLARCAEKQQYYVLLGDLGAMMVKADESKGHPELLARAFLGLNSPQLALKVLEKAKDQKDPDVVLTFAKTYCRVRDWDECLSAADKTVKLVKKPNTPEGKELINRAQKYRARALLHTGKLDLAAKAVTLSEKAGGDAADLAEIRKAMVPAKNVKAVVETEHSPIVPLGIFHLMGKANGANGLAKFFIANVGEDRQFRIEASIEGITTVASRTETILKGQPATFELMPQLAPTFDVNSLRIARAGQLNLKVTVMTDKGESVVFQQTDTVDVLPRDFLPTATWVDEEKALNENHATYIGAWVTPGGKAIETFLSEAKSRAPRSTFAGEQAATIPQVRAVYETLQAKGVSYVMNADTQLDNGYGQRARLPGDVLTSTNAQCLEGAILYAAVFEAIGLQPAIVLVPGHAFVAWKSSPRDAEVIAAAADAGVPIIGAAVDAGTDGGIDGGAIEAALAEADAGVIVTVDAGSPQPVRQLPNPFARAKGGRWLYLETTMTHDASFEAAVLVGGFEFDRAFGNGNARVLVMPELRRLGITPQPWE
ncbi:MAG: hypothetical protein QM817_26870 [Archangium sp.]